MYEKDTYFAVCVELQNILDNITGIRTDLDEGNQWLGALTGDDWKLLSYRNPFLGNRAMCCARHFLASRPDFTSQKSALQEVVENAGHIFELYPKYHCECNWIEMYWGGAKMEARLHCEYTFNFLEANIPKFLDSW